MSTARPTSRSQRPFRYTTKNLYNLLPSIYRQRDSELGKPLEALLGVIAEQVRVIERNIDDLFEDWFIETCDPWVVPYIGDLLGARLLNEEVGGQAMPERAYVANTISYRRRKGTVSMLEELSANITGWPAKVVEFFELLETTQYLNHLRPANLRTPDIRNENALELLDTPFDSIAHTVEVRHISSGRGYYNIPNIGIFLYRLTAFPVNSAPAFPVSGMSGCFQFNALGLDEPLFNHPAERASDFQLAEEVNVPLPIRRTALFDAVTDYYATGDLENSMSVTADGVTVGSDQVTVYDLSGWWRPATGSGQVAIDPLLGRMTFAKGWNPQEVHVSYYYGFSDEVGGGFYQRPDPDAPQAVQVYQIRKVGASGPFQFTTVSAALSQWASTDGKPSAVFEIQDSEVYLEAPITLDIPAGVKVEIRAAELQRPILQMPLSVSALQAAQDPPDTGLFINGIFFDVSSPVLPAISVKPGDLGALTLRHCTIVPLRGASMRLLWSSGGTTNDNLTITLDHTITGGISVDPSISQARLRIEDSIVDGKNDSVGVGSLTLASGLSNAHSPGEAVAVSIATTTTAPSAQGQSYLKVASTKGFVKGGLVVVGAGLPNQESAVVLSKPATNTSLPLAAGLNNSHSAGEQVTMTLTTNTTSKSNSGDAVLKVGATAGLTAGATITINPGGSDSETALVSAVQDGAPGVALNCYQLTIEGSTVLGGTQTFMVNLASNTIFAEPIVSVRRQVGCVRFCYLPFGSRVPRPYKCQPDVPEGATKAQQAALALSVEPVFTSVSYGDPGYAQLATDGPAVIFRGADNGAEMGVFNELLQALRIDNLNASLDQYLRFGMEAGIFLVT